MKSANELLFAYGTLQDREVQMAHFGRELAGREDVLTGYARRPIVIDDPEVVAATGRAEHVNLEASPTDSVSGTCFEVTSQELAAADRYEDGAHYRRIRVRLDSGAEAWVYLRA